MQQSHILTLSHVRTELRSRGDWPGSVQLRRGWSLARARPWNDQSETVASLRLERGGDRFLSACVEWLGGQGVTMTLSPALAQEQSPVWRRAGFEDHLRLVVFERDLREPSGPPLHSVVPDPSPDLAELAAIDDRAFEPTWRVGKRGLADASSATPLSEVLTITDSGTIVGFAIVGEMGSVSYLQRLAVEPDRTRQGLGRSLLRASIDWARTRRAHTMLLNTQPENVAAAALYTAEGFVMLGPKLRVLARQHGPEAAG